MEDHKIELCDCKNGHKAILKDCGDNIYSISCAGKTNDPETTCRSLEFMSEGITEASENWNRHYQQFKLKDK